MAHKTPGPGKFALYTPKAQLNEPTAAKAAVPGKPRGRQGASTVYLRGCAKWAGCLRLVQHDHPAQALATGAANSEREFPFFLLGLARKKNRARAIKEPPSFASKTRKSL